MKEINGASRYEWCNNWESSKKCRGKQALLVYWDEFLCKLITQLKIAPIRHQLNRVRNGGGWEGNQESVVIQRLNWKKTGNCENRESRDRVSMGITVSRKTATRFHFRRKNFQILTFGHKKKHIAENSPTWQLKKQVTFKNRGLFRVNLGTFNSGSQYGQPIAVGRKNC